jgi:hypothetical protein
VDRSINATVPSKFVSRRAWVAYLHLDQSIRSLIKVVRALLVYMVFVLTTCVAACSTHPHNPEVDLDRWVAKFVASIPGRGARGYVPPTREQADVLGAAVRAARADDLVTASRLLGPLAFQARELRDSATGRRLIVLVEQRDTDGSWPHAWGMYVIAPKAASTILIEVPHPVADEATEKLGVAAFRAGAAAALLVAGAHRSATWDADVAHEDGSAFEAVHESLVLPGTRVLQLHGFDGDAHPSRYGDSVVSDGIDAAEVSVPSAATAAVAAALSDAGFRVCLQHRDACSGLAATSNVQGKSARQLGGSFVHIEVETTIRADPERGQQLAQVAAAALR